MNGGRLRAPKEYLRQAAAQRTNSSSVLSERDWEESEKSRIEVKPL